MRYAFCCIFREAWYNMDVGIEWAMLIAFNRRKMDGIKDSSLYKYYEKMSKEYDLIVGQGFMHWMWKWQLMI